MTESQQQSRIRMLYLVGGEGNAERVDISDLFAKRLAGMDFEIDYVIFDLNSAPAWRDIEWHGARAYSVGRSARGGIIGAVINKCYEVLADLRTFWMAMTRDYQIIQIRDKFVVGVLGLIAAKLRGKKFAYWLSYPFAECRVLDAKEGRARIPALSLIGGRVAGWLLYKIIMPNSDHVFVQSKQMLRDVVKEGVKESLMTPVPMAVNDELLDVPSAIAEPKTILYLGTLIRVRRLDILIEALRITRNKHPDARLIYVGDGNVPEDRQFLVDTARKLGLEDAVEFTGMIPMEEAHQRVLKSAVCVSPFFPTPVLQSTSPTKLIEYMALGRPVVANVHPEQSEIIAESGAGICVDWTAESFADAFTKLLDNPDEAENMGTKGRDYVRNKRIYPIIAQDLAVIYQELLSNQ